MKKLGLIINPIAGMGGSVGLKGTDHVLEEAIRRGAFPRAGERVKAALTELLPCREELAIYTYAGKMGGSLAEEMGFATVLLDRNAGKGGEAPVDGPEDKAGDGPVDELETETDARDTFLLATQLLKEEVSLILFAGGDGTARDVYRAVELNAACVGIPAGVKIHSPVYAKTPKAAGSLAYLWLSEKLRQTTEEEVLDIDEEEYRRENISTRLYGYLKVPREKAFTQNRKAPTPVSDTAAIEAISYEVTDNMEPGTCYLIGAGTTTRGIMQKLELKNTLIGVDLVCDKKLVAEDLYGDGILSRIKGKKTKLVVTITGGQGFLFGRGNQQLTPEVIREIGKENIIILATKAKLSMMSGRPLLVDTFDEELNRSLCGYYRVITGYGEYTMCRVSDC